MNLRRFGILKNSNGFPKLIHNYLINNYNFTSVNFETFKNHKNVDMLLTELDKYYNCRDPYFEGEKFTTSGMIAVLVPTYFVGTGLRKGNIIYVQDHSDNISRTLNELDKLMNSYDIWSKYHV